ncbi:MAG TPA: DNA-3-methyladenine glycosylase 2 family protein [Pseudonocardiaceae bacterium]|jgi:DNA-3-methyladenine glycosylase II|nr:DNA-3-methyladenine glycosylase 2 family protein [Pseudonocardiaceae bacterium]
MDVFEVEVTPRGAFDLSRSIGFLEEWPVTQRPADGSVLRFAFCAERDWRPVGVRVAQRGEQVVIRVSGPQGVPEDAADQVVRILSLDVDATVVDRIVDRDPVLEPLVRATTGLRPVCFWTPWEAACWAVLSQRTSMRTASGVKRRIGERLGTPVVVDGEELIAFPAPRTVLDGTGLPGVNPVRLARIQTLAAAALDGTLTAAALRSVPADDALATLRTLPGIGPFSAALILIRGAGAPDVLTTDEPRLLAAIRELYHLPENTTDDDYRAVIQQWRPLRSWVSFWLRATAANLPQ